MLTIERFSSGTVSKFNIDYISIKINIKLIFVEKVTQMNVGIDFKNIDVSCEIILQV